MLKISILSRKLIVIQMFKIKRNVTHVHVQIRFIVIILSYKFQCKNFFSNFFFRIFYFGELLRKKVSNNYPIYILNFIHLNG